MELGNCKMKEISEWNPLLKKHHKGIRKYLIPQGKLKDRASNKSPR